MADVNITYKGASIATMDASGTKALNTQGKYCEGDIMVQYTDPEKPTQTKSVTPTESAQAVTPDSGNVLSQVNVGAIPADYVGTGVTRKSAATFTPTTTDQIILPGQYLTGAQTIKGDVNLSAGNIKKGISVFGILGTYDISLPNVWVWTYTMSNPSANKNFVMLNDPIIAAHYADESAVALLVKMTNRDIAGLNFAFCTNKAISTGYQNYQHIYGNFNGAAQNVATVSSSRLSEAGSTSGKITAYANGDLAIYSAQSNNVVRAGDYLVIFAW